MLSVNSSGVQGILCKQSAGQLTLEQLVHTGDVMMASTSELGQKEVRQDVANAQQQFDEFFNGMSCRMETPINPHRPEKKWNGPIMKWKTEVKK